MVFFVGFLLESENYPSCSPSARLQGAFALRSISVPSESVFSVLWLVNASVHYTLVRHYYEDYITLLPTSIASVKDLFYKWSNVTTTCFLSCTSLTF